MPSTLPMIAKQWGSSRPVWLGPLLIIVLSGLLLLAGPAATRDLAFDRASINAGQWWRLCTGNWVHLGFWHWFLNALSLLLWLGVCPQRLRLSDWLLRLLVIGTGMSLGLYFLQPHLLRYVGLSGFIYGVFLLDLGNDALRRHERFAWFCLVFLVARVGYEVWTGAPAYEVRLIGGQVASMSHIWGMVTAAIYGMVAYAVERVRGTPATDPDTRI